MKFCDFIKYIRGKQLLSQSDFANEIGVSFSTVNRWENGKSIPKISTYKLICNYCRINNIPFDAEDYFLQEKNNKIGLEK